MLVVRGQEIVLRRITFQPAADSQAPNLPPNQSQSLRISLPKHRAENATGAMARYERFLKPFSVPLVMLTP